jgi:hypothetical protein
LKVGAFKLAVQAKIRFRNVDVDIAGHAFRFLIFFLHINLIELQRQTDQLDDAVRTKNDEVKTLLNYKVWFY